MATRTSKGPAAKTQQTPAPAAKTQQVPVMPPKIEVSQSKNPAPCPITLPCLPVRTPPGAVVVRPVAVTPERADYRLTVRQEALVEILDRTFGPGGWCCRRYACGGQLFTGLGLYVPQVDEFVFKDAPKGSQEDETGFIKAASMWNICRDVSMVDTIRLSSEQVSILPIPGQDGKSIRGYRPERLTVDKMVWDDVGQIVQVQLITEKGAKIVWPGT